MLILTSTPYHLQFSLIQIFCLKRILSFVVYRGIIQRRGTTASFLLGWGVIVPFSMAFPFWLIRVFGIENCILRLSLSTVPTMGIFRTIEAMCNTSPIPIVETSWEHYSLYWSSLHHFEWMTTGSGKKIRKKIQLDELLRNTMDLILTFTLLSLLLSAALYCNFQPFPSSVDLLSFAFQPAQLFAPAHLANSYCSVVVVYYALKFLFELDAWKSQVGDGVVTKPVFRRPLWASTGPRDFWSRRWNLMIHRILKHGVYHPISASAGTKTSAALLATFVASGLLHELSWQLMGIGIPGKLTAFFLWNGVLVGLEPLVIGPVLRFLLHHKCPVWIVSTLVVLLAMPVAHYYTGDWAWGGVLDDLKLGLWTIRPRQTVSSQ